VNYISVTARVLPGEDDEGGFVVHSDELGLASEGDTIEEALRNFEGALKEFISGLYEMGDLDEFLRARDIRVYDQPPSGDRTVQITTGELVSAIVATLGKSVAVL
jgi:predicted RNase H-like HicB family nuclease